MVADAVVVFVFSQRLVARVVTCEGNRMSSGNVQNTEDWFPPFVSSLGVLSGEAELDDAREQSETLDLKL